MPPKPPSLHPADFIAAETDVFKKKNKRSWHE